jgi:hypothetical protein
VFNVGEGARSHWFAGLSASSASVDVDCTRGMSAASLAATELQLLRVERRAVHSHAQTHDERLLKRKPKARAKTELLLGDVHTRQQRQRTYHPTAYQPYSLLKEEQVRHNLH